MGLFINEDFNVGNAENGLHSVSTINISTLASLVAQDSPLIDIHQSALIIDLCATFPKLDMVYITSYIESIKKNLLFFRSIYRIENIGGEDCLVREENGIIQHSHVISHFENYHKLASHYASYYPGRAYIIALLTNNAADPQQPPLYGTRINLGIRNDSSDI